jgi:hypothetical protein
MKNLLYLMIKYLLQMEAIFIKYLRTPFFIKTIIHYECYIYIVSCST